MKLYSYSLFDEKMGVYLTPFFARNDVDASRQIAAALKDPQLAHTPMALSPGDFAMVKVAEFDDERGEFDPVVKADRTRIMLNTLVSTVGS